MRKLPDDPEKRRRQVFKRIYQNLQHWDALREDRGMDDVIDAGDEDIFRGDLMVGYDYLPPRQQQAFDLICLQGYTETAARDVLLPNSKSSTPVQQYADSGLVRMIAAYDAKQEGNWPPAEVAKKSKPKAKTKRRSIVMPVLEPIVRKGLERTLKEITEQIDALLRAKTQVEGLLGITGTSTLAATTGQTNDSRPEQPAPQPPAPNPKPEGKPRLEDMARELATASTA